MDIIGLVRLNSVGCAIDIETHMVYTQMKDSTIDEDTGTHIDDVTDEFFDELKGDDLKLLFHVVGEEAFNYYRTTNKPPHIVG